MKKVNLLKRLLLGISFPFPCRLKNDVSVEFCGARHQSREGDELQIVHLHSPEAPLAVFVYSVPLNRVLGQLTKHASQTLIKAFGKGFCVDGELHARIQDGEDFRIELLVFNRQSLMNNADFSSLHE